MKEAHSSSLKARVLRTGIWTVGAYGIESGIRLASNLVMAWLLFPDDFGLMAIVFTIPAALAMLSEVGIRSSIIRKVGRLEDDFLRTAWTLQAIRGLALWFVLLVASLVLMLPAVRGAFPPASALADPRLPLLLAVTGLTLVLSGFQSVNLFVLDRELRIKRNVVLGIVCKLVAIPPMVAIAYVYQSVWALSVGTIVAQFALFLGSYLVVPGIRMRVAWVSRYVKPLLSDGKWITLSSANGLLTSQGDRFVLAVIMPVEQLGLYSIAFLLLDSIRALMQKLRDQLALAVVIEAQKGTPELAITKYYRYRRPFDTLAFGAAGLLWISGPAIVQTLYGQKYSGAGEMLQILSFSLIAFPFGMIADVFFVKGNPRMYAYLSILGSVSFLILITVGSFFGGSQGALWAIAFFRWPQVAIATGRAWMGLYHTCRLDSRLPGRELFPCPPMSDTALRSVAMTICAHAGPLIDPRHLPPQG